MRLLLDTQIYLWSVEDSPRLRTQARDQIRGAAAVYVSAASIWEVAIKAGSGKLRVDPAALAAAIETSGFTELPVLAAHAQLVSTLPAHHRDPFDRLLVAQAMSVPLRLLSTDALLQKYTPLVMMA